MKLIENISDYFYWKWTFRPRIWRMTKAFFFWGWKMRDRHWWDSAFLMQTMADYFKYMAENFTDEKTLVMRWRQTQKELKICSHLCDRMANDKYTTPWDDIEPTWDKEDHQGGCMWTNTNTDRENFLMKKRYERQNELYKHDMEMLTKLMKRKFRTWWD